MNCECNFDIKDKLVTLIREHCICDKNFSKKTKCQLTSEYTQCFPLVINAIITFILEAQHFVVVEKIFH